MSPVPAVVLKPYDPCWPLRYQEARKPILAALGTTITALEHVGSTSIIGMPAKATIDLAGTVCHFSLLEGNHGDPLAALGYAFVPHEWFPTRRFFRKGPGGGGTHHVHLFEEENEAYFNLLRFCDYLRNHPKAAREYRRLKLALLETVKNRNAYTTGKPSYITSILRLARADQPVCELPGGSPSVPSKLRICGRLFEYAVSRMIHPKSLRVRSNPRPG